MEVIILHGGGPMAETLDINVEIIVRGSSGMVNPET